MPCRRQEKEREDKKKKFEEQKQQHVRWCLPSSAPCTPLREAYHAHLLSAECRKRTSALRGCGSSAQARRRSWSRCNPLPKHVELSLLTSMAWPRICFQRCSQCHKPLRQAFKTETVGLVTKAEFMHKRNTLKERLEEEQRRSAKAATQAAQQVWRTAHCVLPETTPTTR